MTDTSPPPLNSLAQIEHDIAAQGWWPTVGRPALVRLAWLLAAYLVLTGVIYGFWVLERVTGSPGLGVWGMVLDVILLAGAVTWLARRHHPMAASLGPVLALAVVILFFAIGDEWFRSGAGNFWSLDTLRLAPTQASPIAVAALGMTVIIIAGGIDLSAGTALALCATVLAAVLKVTESPALALLACMGAGVATGLLNGSLICLLRVVPFIVTLGTMKAFLGLAKLVANAAEAGGSSVTPARDLVPQALRDLAKPDPWSNPDWAWVAYPLAPNFAWGIWLCLGLALLLGAVLHLTVFGRRVFAIGSNEQTARLCGVNVPLTKILVYALAGLFVGIAGAYQFSVVSIGSPTSGVGLELMVIAAVVIGGGSLSGGRGSIVGTLCGAAIIFVINTGCSSLGVDNAVQDVIIGAIIVAAVTLDQIREGRLNWLWRWRSAK